MASFRILCIGNSYSVGATKYLHQIAKQYGDDIDACNLYIGGCSLERHARNIREEIPDYRIFRNGDWYGLPNVRIGDYINAEKWDYITFQQASYLSYKWESYQPYLTEIAEYARSYNPNAKFLIHQTQVCSTTRCKRQFGISGRDEMYERLVEAYNNAAKSIDAVGILPTGEASQIASEKYGVIDNLLYSDPGSHLSARYGEYMAGLVWYSVLTGKNVADDKYEIPGADERFTKLMRLSAQEAADKYRF
ncbi:MAG: DUF4886 domain-containing protein [Ruminococcaceae bacterium]|nr:DUF4886 domain-containing protein [Oscillospiraceae bacterium]